VIGVPGGQKLIMVENGSILDGPDTAIACE
jgi:hypothetical protein